MSQDNLPRTVRQKLASQNKSRITINLTTSGEDNTFSFERDDLTQETLELVHAEAAGLTSEAKNRYTIGSELQKVSLSSNGRPAPVTDGGAGGDNTFSTEYSRNSAESEKALSSFEESSDTKMLNIEVIKGNAIPKSNNSYDYIRLLQDVNDNQEKSKIAGSIEKLQTENNRFSEKQKYINSGEKEGTNSVGDLVIQKTLGSHGPRKFPDSVEATIIKVKSLKNMGLQMIMAAAGEHVIPEDVDDFGQVVAAKAAGLVPGTARLGLKVPVKSFSAESRMAIATNGKYSKPKNEIELSSTDVLSHGSYNNPLAPFDSVDSRSSVAACTILISTIGAIFKVLSLALDSKVTSFISNTIFGITNDITVATKNDYSLCVEEGTNVFFGTGNSLFGFAASINLSALGVDASISLGGPNRFNDEPGYYNTVLRNLTKIISYDVVGNVLGALAPLGLVGGNVGPFSTNKALDVDPNIGLTSDPTNIGNSLRKLLNSRTVGIMNILATIGDISLSQKELGIIDSNPLEVGETFDTRMSDVYEADSFAGGDNREQRINPASLIRSNNLSPESRKLLGYSSPKALAWGQGTTPSAYILPDSIITAGDALGGMNAGKNLLTKLTKDKNFIVSEGTNRLSQDVVTQIENELESSYFPFYFHDLRTNEIISFHAFLANLTDGYNVEYSEQTGYGRVGKVGSYKNTERNVSFSFYVVATNNTDFDTMWWKINKLITLLHPQWTAGRTLESNGQKFIQPFSQLPAASPLIRIRIGDVIKSNYSKFNLARLFGLGQGRENFSINTQNIERERVRTETLRTSADNIRARMQTNEFRVSETFWVNVTATNTLELAEDLNPTSIVPTPGGTRNRGRSARSIQRRVRTSSLTPNRYLARVEQSPFDFNLGGDAISGPVLEYKIKIDGVASEANKRYIVRLTNQTQYRSPNGNESNVGITNIEINEDEVIHQAALLSNPLGEDSGASELQQSDTRLVQDFLNGDVTNSQANPIFKAFETTKGKGLAGFIKSFTFDWSEATWNVDGINNRAPNMCKIDINFSPIHDLNPGLDSNGFNSAPVYRVGSVADAVNNTIHQDKSEHDSTTSTYKTLISKSQYKKTGNGSDGPLGGVGGLF